VALIAASDTVVEDAEDIALLTEDIVDIIAETALESVVVVDVTVPVLETEAVVTTPLTMV